jgi:putative aminopeptidase FrvX
MSVKPTLLIMAHMDEVGFITTDIIPEGFVRAQPLGGWMTHVLWGHEWIIQTKDKNIRAVTGMDSPHVLSDFTKSPSVEISNLFLILDWSKKN